MKKNYIQPEISVISIVSANMLATSGDGSNNDFIPVKPNENGPAATKGLDAPWSSNEWGN